MKVCCRILIRSGGDIGVDMRRRLAKHAVGVGVYVKATICTILSSILYTHKFRRRRLKR